MRTGGEGPGSRLTPERTATEGSASDEGVSVHDLLFVLLILGMFGLLALCAKGVEKL